MDVYHILYDFSKVDYKYKENISFEEIISGTFTICGKVLDASRIIGFDYSYSDSESTLTIKLDTSKWDFRLKKEVLFSYQLNVDDASCPSVCSSTNDGYTIEPDSTVTIIANIGCQSFVDSTQSCSYYSLIYKPCEEPTGNPSSEINGSSFTNKEDVIDLSFAYGYTISDQPNFKGITINLQKGQTTTIIDFRTDPFFNDFPDLTGKLSARLDSIDRRNSTATITFTSSSCRSSTQTAS